MVIALIIAAASIVGGSLLALLPTRRSQILGPIRTFGLTASASVVVLHLLPEVYEARGALGLLAFFAALLAPSVLGSVRRVATSSPSDAKAEWVTLRITYLSLLVHSVADGIALSAYSGHMHDGKPHYDVLVALSAHTVPVAAVMTLTVRDFRGIRLALFSALGLWIATSVGVIGAGLVPHAVVEGAAAWVGAVVAGLLLHVVTHDLGGHAPARPLERAVDLVAATAGIGVGLLSGDAHSHLSEARGMGSTLGHALLEITLKTAPLLLLGLGLGAFVQTFRSRIPSTWLSARGGVGLRGVLAGFLLPIAGGKLLPIARALDERRASVVFVTAFLLASPALGLETLALTLGLLGWEFAGLRLGAALLLALLAGLLVGRFARANGGANEPSSLELAPRASANALRRYFECFAELFQPIGAWMVLGIVAAAFVEALVPARAAVAVESPLIELGVMTLLTIPSFICAPAAIPLGAVLVTKGISLGAVLAGLLLGPAIHLRFWGFLRASYGARVSACVIVVTVVVGWASAFAMNAGAFTVPVPAAAHDWVGIVGGVVLSVLWFRSLWRSGTRAWFASVLHPDPDEPESHGHAEKRGPSHGLLEHGSALR